MTNKPVSLTNLVSSSFEQPIHRRHADDQIWIDVIQQMDSIYTDLVNSQVELEEKNGELEDSKNFIQSIVSSISDILIVCDINSNIQQVNNAFLQMTGLNEKNTIGQPVANFFSKNHRHLITNFPEHIRTDNVVDCEIELVNHHDELFPITISCSAHYDHDKRLSGFIITGHPIGELRKAYGDLKQTHEELKIAQQYLVQSEKMASLGRLVAGVAHELNNPISFLYANMHALKSYEKKFIKYMDAVHQNIDTESRDKLRTELNIDRMMKDIEPLIEGSLECAERVSDIVQNLSQFTTPQEQKEQSFNIISVIERATSWVVKATPITPEVVTIYPESLNIKNSEGHVHQILINLIQNAVDAMSDIKKPLLRIRIKNKKNSIEICIHDNGYGINKENLNKIFDPFYTTKAVGSGTGLGLYISYGLATKQCGGDLIAHNHADGGAEFILSLPQKDIS